MTRVGSDARGGAGSRRGITNVATLSSSSTLGQVQAEYADTASYAEDGSTDKCRRFITACRILILKTPKKHGTRDSQNEYNPDLIREEMREAQAWLERVGGETAVPAADGTEQTRSRLTYASFKCARR